MSHDPGQWSGSWYYPDYSCPPPVNFLNYPPPVHPPVPPYVAQAASTDFPTPPLDLQATPQQPSVVYATGHVAYPPPYSSQNSTHNYTPSSVIFTQPPPPIPSNPSFPSAGHTLQPQASKEPTTKDANKRSPSPPPRRKRRSRSLSPRRMRPGHRNCSKSPHYRDRRSSNYMSDKLHRRDRSCSKRRSSRSPSESPNRRRSSRSPSRCSIKRRDSRSPSRCSIKRRDSRSPSRCSSKRHGSRSPSSCSSKRRSSRSPSRCSSKRRSSRSPSKCSSNHRSSRNPSRSRKTRSPSHTAREERCGSRYPASRASTSRDFSRPSSRAESRKPSVNGEPAPVDTDAPVENMPEEPERKQWIRSTPADLYYAPDVTNPKVMKGTVRLEELCAQFKEKLVDRAARAREGRPVYEPPPRRHKPHLHKCRRMPGSHKPADSSSSCSSDSETSSSSEDEADCSMRELERKRLHPDRLHPELWFNDPGEMNDGPLCRCSAKAQRSGIRHGIYAGELPLLPCDPNTNNLDRLYHYRITIAPPTNFLTKVPTIIRYDSHEFIFEGFSMFSHSPLASLPICKVIRFNIQYAIVYVEEKSPENFTIAELSLFFDYLFRELLELVDLDFKAAGDVNGCPRFHFMPRFVRDLPDNGIEILSMNRVLSYLLEQSKPLIEQEALATLLKMAQFDWQNFADEVKGMLVTYPGAKPCSLRVDQIDREQQTSDFITFPEIVHFGIRPPQLSYAGNADYQREWREYVKLRHLVANMPKPSFEDKRRLESKENKLQEMRMQHRMKRDVTVAVSAQDFHRTGIMCDIIQHAMLVPVLVCHLRFHQSLDTLEQVIEYKFKNRYLLQLALTHPSYRENFGTNPDHARNSLTNCGIRQPEYGDRRIHYLNTRKRGINTLINIMSRFGKKCETESNITHNERLEFLGDAVVEFLSSIHLFYMFPDLEEGGLATYRAAIVQNQHLAVLAKTLKLEEYMLYAHGSDLCHDLELRHAMANCFEALMGALFLDGGIDVADKVFAITFFHDEPENLDVWINCPKHPLQEQEPDGDRHWISQFPLLVKMTQFEDSIGVEFSHIRLLARAFTDRSIGYNNLTLGSNQRLEFLGDTVLQLIASEYLYKHFPEHHEGHLSLLRSSLVNNRTQAVVCDDLGMTSYALYSNPKAELKTKDRADLLEAFLGALYVDLNMDFCELFCNVCFFPRLQDFIMNQDWNDPKSKLQQCCLTLRTMDGGEPDIPVYKVIECKGPTNTRIYSVAVYFRGQRLATATGHSIQMAEMNAAKSALQRSQSLFPQLNHQKRVIAKSMKKQRRPREGTRKERSPSPRDYEESRGSRRCHQEHKSKSQRRGGSRAAHSDISNSPGK